MKWISLFFFSLCIEEISINKNVCSKKISKETSQPNKKFLLNCGIGIGEQLEPLSNVYWIIQNEQYDNNEWTKSESKNVRDNLMEDFSNILAYNNNTLDKMIMAHVYQQRFGEVMLNTIIKYNNYFKLNMIFITLF